MEPVENDGLGEEAERRNMKQVPSYVAMVGDRHEAQRIATLLTTQYRDNVFGADTEVSDWRGSAKGVIVSRSPH